MPALKSRTSHARSVYQSIPVQDLTGGLDLRRDPTLLEPTRSVVCRNFSLAEPGALRVRAGYRAFTTQALSSASTSVDRTFQGGQRVYLGSTQGTLLAYHGGVYLLPDASTWPSTAQVTGFSTANQIYFTHDRDLVAAFDGSTRAQKSTDLVTWTKFGIDPSTLRCTAAVESTSGTDMSTSEFAFVFTYKDRGLSFESDPTTAVSTITLTSTGNGVKLTVPNSTDPLVDAIVVYARN